jgi:glutamine amidotransferase
MIVIVDYGIGNLASLKNMFNYLGVKVCISRNKEKIINAEKLILPGVGSFDAAINKLDEFELISVLNNFTLDRKKPILGICLGM